MTETIHLQGEQLLLPTAKEHQFLVAPLKQLGLTPGKTLLLQGSIPCWFGRSLPLLYDALVQTETGEAMALVLCGLPLENEQLLRVVAEVYSNSAKASTGLRPAIYFYTEGKCKVANGVLGHIAEVTQPSTWEQMLQSRASHNLQEEALFSWLLADPEKAKAFFDESLDIPATNQMLSTYLEEADKVGLYEYYETVACSTKERRTALKKEALLLLAMGEENYRKQCTQQVETVLQLLAKRATEVFGSAVAKGNWQRAGEPSPLGRLLTWAWAFTGWKAQTALKPQFAVPCYYNELMQLPCDYALLDDNGRPAVLYLEDSLHLEPKKAFVVSEFYARSCKAKYGLTPYVLYRNEKGAYLRMGALSGGFAPIHSVLSKEQLLVQLASVNVTERYIFQHLLEDVPKLRQILDETERLQEQVRLVQAYGDACGKEMQEKAVFRTAFDQCCSDTTVDEEVYWQALMGKDAYDDQRREELSFLRTFAADKRLLFQQKEKK